MITGGLLVKLGITKAQKSGSIWKWPQKLKVPGRWGPRRGSQRGALYEEQVRQHLNNPENQNLFYGADDVAYDGWNSNSKAFFDAKHSEGRWYTDNFDQPFRNDAILTEALRQLENSGSYGLEWWTNTVESARFLKSFFLEHGLDIKVIKWP